MIEYAVTPSTDVLEKYKFFAGEFSNPIIPDEETAKEVAKDILIPIYGKECIKEESPFAVIYDAEYDVWVVSGTLKANRIGGVATIIIQKSDGKVLAVAHTK